MEARSLRSLSQKSLERSKKIMENFVSNPLPFISSGFDEAKFDLDDYEAKLSRFEQFLQRREDQKL